ncbi:MAG: hypothetical protein ACI9CO_002151 [Candidatus Azotimanducaceae bacterium]|jgi:hypothetical protein
MIKATNPSLKGRLSASKIVYSVLFLMQVVLIIIIIIIIITIIIIVSIIVIANKRIEFHSPS